MATDREIKHLERQQLLQTQRDALSKEIRDKTAKIKDATTEADKKSFQSEKNNLLRQRKQARDLQNLSDNVRQYEKNNADATEHQLNERKSVILAEHKAQEKIKHINKKLQTEKNKLSKTEIDHLNDEKNKAGKASKLLKDRQKQIENRIADPLNVFQGLFGNIGESLTGGLKGLAETTSGKFKESGLGKTIDLGSKLFGKSETLGDDKMFSGIREIFTDPAILKQKKIESEIAKQSLVRGMSDTEKEEFERKESLGTSGNLAENLIGGIGKVFSLGNIDIEQSRKEEIEKTDLETLTENTQEANLELEYELETQTQELEKIDDALRGSPPYLEVIRDTLIFIKDDISAIKDIFVTEERKESAGKKEKAAEEQQRHDELVAAQEGTSIPEEDKEIEVKSPGFLEKIGQGLGGGLKGIVTGIFDTIKAFVDGISGVLKSALNLIKTFVDGIGSIVQKIAKVITSTFITLMKGLGQGIAFLFKALGKIDPYTLTIASIALGVLTVGMIGLAFAFRIMAPVIKIVADLLVGVLGKIVEFAKVLVPVIKIISETILGVLGKIVEFGARVIVPIIQTISNTILGLMNGLITFVSTVGNLVITGIQTITASIVELANIPFQNLLGLAAGFVTLGISLAAFGITSAIAIPSLLALGAAALGLSKLLDHEPEKIRNLADGFLILGKSVKGFAKDAKALGGVVLSMAALSAIPFAGKLIDLAIAKTESLNVASTEREGIYNTSDQNQQLKDTRTADQSSLNQNNIVTSNIISSSNQNNIIKPQIRDESLHWSMANNLVQTI